jgi:hypothetical protein
LRWRSVLVDDLSPVTTNPIKERKPLRRSRKSTSWRRNTGHQINIVYVVSPYNAEGLLRSADADAT